MPLFVIKCLPLISEIPFGTKVIKNDNQNRLMISIERFAFYDFAKTSYAVIQTGERRFYGCFMLRKGVIPPEE